jgi:hypothetical protein
MKTKTCIICKKDFSGTGHSGYPITNIGSNNVCSYCDRYVVLPAKMSDDIVIPDILRRNNIEISKDILRDDLKSLKPGDRLYEEFSEILEEPVKVVKQKKTTKKKSTKKVVKKKATKKKRKTK